MQLFALDSAIKLMQPDQVAAVARGREGQEGVRARAEADADKFTRAAAVVDKCKTDATCYVELPRPADPVHAPHGDRWGGEGRVDGGRLRQRARPTGTGSSTSSDGEARRAPGSRWRRPSTHSRPSATRRSRSQLEKLVTADMATGNKNLMMADDVVAKVAARLRARRSAPEPGPKHDSSSRSPAAWRRPDGGVRGGSAPDRPRARHGPPPDGRPRLERPRAHHLRGRALHPAGSPLDQRHVDRPAGHALVLDETNGREVRLETERPIELGVGRPRGGPRVSLPPEAEDAQVLAVRPDRRHRADDHDHRERRPAPPALRRAEAHRRGGRALRGARGHRRRHVRPRAARDPRDPRPARRRRGRRASSRAPSRTSPSSRACADRRASPGPSRSRAACSARW